MEAQPRRKEWLRKEWLRKECEGKRVNSIKEYQELMAWVIFEFIPLLKSRMSKILKHTRRVQN